MSAHHDLHVHRDSRFLCSHGHQLDVLELTGVYDPPDWEQLEFETREDQIWFRPQVSWGGDVIVPNVLNFTGLLSGVGVCPGCKVDHRTLYCHFEILCDQGNILQVWTVFIGDTPTRELVWEHLLFRKALDDYPRILPVTLRGLPGG